MPTLIGRVGLLEEKMEGLSNLPARMKRVEDELGALRMEMRGGFAKVREEIREGDEETRRQMRILHEDVIAKLQLLREGIVPVNGGAKRRRSPRGK